MIIGLGTDICENYRIEDLLAQYGKRFLNRVYLQDEQEYCMARKNPIPHLSARFALKESFIKALGIARNLKLSYADVGLLGTMAGKKQLHVQGQLKELYENTNANKIFFSISHAKQYSSAYVILELNK